MRKAKRAVGAIVLGLLLVTGISPGHVNAETQGTDLTANLPIDAQITNERDGKELVEASSCNTFNLWLYNPNCTYSKQRQTIYRIDNAELRIGYFQGVQYGWGKFVTPEPGATVWLDVDTNGDGIWDKHSRADHDGFTIAHATNWSAPSVKAIRIAVRHANNSWSFGPWWSW